MNAETNKKTNEHRVTFILHRLNEGKTKNDIATELGYSNYKSLDMFMKRHGYSWDQRDKYYLPMKKGEKNHQPQTFPKGRVEKVLFLLKKGLDTKDIAKQLHFDNHRGMATFMKSKGYTWDEIEHTFIRDSIPPNMDRADNVDSYEEEEIERSISTNDIPSFQKYLAILEVLDQNKDRIAEIFDVDMEEIGKIPRYVLPGVTVTKSVHMIYGLDQLVRDFSKEKNISQREIFEVALIHFLKKYGYKKEIEALLES